MLSSATGKGGQQLADNVPGGINTLNSVLLRKSVVSRLSRYDLLLGVVRAESYFAFNGEDVQYGIEGDRRSKILKTFVRENYRYHLSEILATIVNEYTDWERPVQHPINIRDETLEALSDAMYVAPAIHTADLHSASRRNSYLYVFDYQTKFGDFPQVSPVFRSNGEASPFPQPSRSRTRSRPGGKVFSDGMLPRKLFRNLNPSRGGKKESTIST